MARISVFGIGYVGVSIGGEGRGPILRFGVAQQNSLLKIIA